MRDSCSPQRTFSDAANPHHGTMGTQSFHPHTAKIAGHEEAVLRSGQTQV